MASIWMGDLEPYMTEQFIREAFTSSGEVVLNVKIVSDRTLSGKPGYCFVDFSDVASVERCLLRLNGSFIPGSNPRKKFKLNYSTSQTKKDNTPDFSIFVGDLSPEVDDFQLLYFFLTKYPSCRGSKVATDTLGKSRGFGFVKFGDVNEQTRALKECHLINGLGTKPLRLRVATSKRLTPEDQPSASFDYTPYYQQYQNYYANAGYDPYAASGYTDYSSPGAYSAENNSLVFSQDGTEVPTAPVETNYYEDSTNVLDTLDTDALNQIYMSRSEEVFDALMNCHWQPLDTVTSNIPSAI